MKGKAANLVTAMSKHLASTFIVCGYGILLCVSICGLDRDRTIAQLYHTAWTSIDGAPGKIEALAQTNDGYLWLGTATGLYRFDGVLFERYEPRSGGPLPSNNIFSLFATPDGGLWIGFRNGGVSFLKDENLIYYGEREGVPTGRVQGFARDNEDVIWTATSGGLARLEGSNWQRVGMERNYPGKGAQKVFVDSAGTLWVATEDTIVFRPKGTDSFQPTGEQIGQVLQITQAPDGALWMAETTRSVRPIRLPGINPESAGPEISVGSVGVLFDREGALWATTIGDGIRRVPFAERFRGKKIAQFSTDAEIFTEKDGLSANYAMAILEDREGNIWIGTANGLDRFRERSLVPVRFPPGYYNFGLVAADGGEVWAFSGNRPLIRINGNETSMLTSSGVPMACAYRDEDNTIWFGGDKGFYRLRRGELLYFNSPIHPQNTDIKTIFKDRSGVLWVYLNREGIFLFKDGVWTRYDKQSELPKGAAIAATLDSSDRKWFGYARNVLTVIDGDRIRTFSRDDGLEVGDVKSIQASSQNIWVGGEFGLSVFDGNRFRMLATEGAEGIGGVSGIVETREGSLWLNSSRGVIHIPADEVRLALQDVTYKLRYRLFDFLDGLPGAPQQDRPFPTVVEGSDGRLWFSTNKGVVWIDPKRISRNTVPPAVSIRSLIADEKSYEPVPSLELPKGTMRLQINFTARSLSIPERVRFRYRLEGVDNEWHDLGTERKTTYTNLGPGSYRFRVMASNNDGVWNEEGAFLEFSVPPMFYQTNWFRLLIFLFALLSTAGILGLVYRWRLARATERLNIGFEERLAERTRIAHELHDTLLQGFFGATMRLQAISDILPAKSDEAKKDLDNVLDRIDTVLEEGRRSLWDMHSSSVAETDLIQAFTLAGEDLNKTYPANFSLTMEGESRPLHPLVRDQIYRIGREALTNAFRHSQATNIEVEIEYAPKYLRIAIRDNGCGISPDYLSAGRIGHLGLSGMREYAEKIGAELKIWSRPESGTAVELIVPHQIAYIIASKDGFFRRLRRLASRKDASARQKNRGQ